ncbi:hypothetical protein TcWFU_002285 [Taenia crassiceps]|uniref:Uncharacterized protein n=1 Tax=Taenia crassiceps TaxID=6207 RepID=A0ABR4QJS1_9CEST
MECNNEPSQTQLIMELKNTSREMALQLLLVVAMALMASGSVYDEFKQWDPVHWVVRSTDHVELPCYHSRHFPFNNLSSIMKVQWILPAHMSYLHMSPGNESEGWKVMEKEQNYKLVIEKAKMNKPETVNGMYLCAALAEILPQVENNKTYAWFYLRWGVGLYSNVPANMEGSIAQKYHWPFTYGWVSVLVTLVAIILFSTAVHFRYRGGPKVQDDEESFAISSITPTTEENPSSLPEKVKFQSPR